MGALLQDLKYGLRIHAKTRGLTTIAVLTLALGIGACTAVFGVIDAILLRPLPYSESEKIVIPWRLAPKGAKATFDKWPWRTEEFHLFLQDSKTFQKLGAFQRQSFNLTGVDHPKYLDGLRVSSEFFSVLGVSPIMGRTFAPAGDQVERDHEVILSYNLWQEYFGSSQHLIGLSLDLDEVAYTVIGVMPPEFTFPHGNEMPGNFAFPRETQFWVPLALPPDSPRGTAELTIIGRLKPGVSVQEAQSELDVFSRRLDEQYPKAKGWFNFRVVPLNMQVVGDTRLPLWLMMAAVAAVLLIACSNVAGLLLTRSLARRREFTVRAVLGAGHRRLVRQVLTESLLLTIAALVLGVLIGQAGIYLVKALGPANIPRLQEARMDPKVLVFAVGITLITGVFFGLAPAVGAVRKNLAESLKEGQRSNVSPVGPRTRKVLIISQVALALVLVIAAGLVTKTFFRLLNVETGFNAKHVLTFQLSLVDAKYREREQRVIFYDKLLHQLQSVSGVKSVGIVDAGPLGGAPDTNAIQIPGQSTSVDKQSLVVSYNIASPGYFSAVGTPLLRGRDFLESDTADSLPVTIVNDSMAKKFWSAQDAIGKQVRLDLDGYPLMTIIGIVADIKHTSLREPPTPEMYVPYTQKAWPSLLQMQVAVRALADPTSVTKGTESAIRSVDPGLAVANLATLERLAANAMAEPRFAMLLLGYFGMLALILASVGMYSVLSYSVSQRTQEIGVRMALGARGRDVFAMVLGQGVRLAGIGILLGLLAALSLTQIVGSSLYGILYGVTPTDPLVYGAAVSLLLLSVALLACYVPARRAMRVHPVIALRDE